MFRGVRLVITALLALGLAVPLHARGDEPEILVGTVVILPGSGPAPFILVAVDVFSDGAAGDGVIDHVYKYYNDDVPDLDYRFDMAFVQHEQGRLVVTAPQEKVKLSFFLGPARRTRPSGVAATESVFAGGSGLSHYWGESARAGSIRTRDAQTNAIGCGGDGSGAECFNDWENGGGGGGCQAGGVGATSCSLTVNGQQCSTECHLGYACCKYVNGTISCRCVM